MSITVFDRLQILPPGDLKDIEAQTSPFAVKILFENPASKPELQQQVKSCVNTSNTICIGVSPKLKYTWTEIGLDTGIRKSDYDLVGRAGNPDFKTALDKNNPDPHGWANGVKAIISRAQTLQHKELSPATTAPSYLATTAVPPHSFIPRPPSEPLPAWPFVLGLGFVGAVLAVIWYQVSRQQKRTRRVLENLERETAEMASNNIKSWSKEKEPDEKLNVFSMPASPVPIARPAKPIPAAPLPPKQEPETLRDIKGIPLDLSRKPIVTFKSPTPAPRTVPRPQTTPPRSSRPPRRTTPAPAVVYAPTYMSTYDSPTRRQLTPTPKPTSSSFSSGGGGGSIDSASGGGGGGDFGSSSSSDSSGGGGGGDI